MGNKAFLTILSTCMLLIWAISPMAWAGQGPSVVVHFDKGQSFLSSKDKAGLRELFQSYAVGPESRVFVLGYTDAVGDATGNYRLSRKRAQSVRREIVSSFAIDATIVMAMGKGEENPVADNRKARGRALNRRAEIYLANTPAREPSRVYGPKDPYLPTIRGLVQEAEALIKRQALNDAIHKLDEARAMGGDHYSDWHAVYGIAGYYGNAPNERIENHLQTALKLDPYNYKAREFLSRAQARRKVNTGDVTKEMGMSVSTAINVTAVAQEHEFLRLFGVAPLNHRELENMPVDVWECLDADGAKVAYYFNHAGIYAWAFGDQARPEPPRPVSVPASRLNNPSAAPAVAPAVAPANKPEAVPIRNADSPDDGQSVSDPRQIWESRVFQ